MSVEPFPRDALASVEGQFVTASESAGSEPSRELELYALARLLSHRLIGGWRGQAAKLPDALRRERLADLLALWNSGCRFAVDEVLLGDLADRYPAEAEAFRRARRPGLAALS